MVDLEVEKLDTVQWEKKSVHTIKGAVRTWIEYQNVQREKADEEEEEMEVNSWGEKKWLPPHEGTIKLNTDATVDTRKG